MASKILPFPAKSCFFFVTGRCSLHYVQQALRGDERQCSVLTHWERLHDRALDLAEKHRLDGAGALRLVAGSLEQAQGLELLCASYQPGGGDITLDCIFFHRHLCMQFLPLCAGVCPHFQARPKLTRSASH